MTCAALEGKPWSKRRWAAMVTCLMLGQLGCIFWLSRHHPAVVHAMVAVPTVVRAGDDILDRVALNNPARFTLASQHGFSAGAWLEVSPLQYQSPEWTEPPRPLTIAPQKLGSAMAEMVRNDSAHAFEPVAAPEPQLAGIVPLPELPTESMLTVEGELAGRPLVAPLKLASWTAPEILSNSVVQVGVKADGTVFSAVLLDGPKDSKEARAADASALNLARAARFHPLVRIDVERSEPPDADLQWGRMVFQWHTVAPPPTNSTATNP